jgi:hypothetical protein
MTTCVSCSEPTDDTVPGQVGDRQGVLCADCQHWCDGNVIER